MGKQTNKGKTVGQIASEVGIMNLATKGLGTRVIMIGTLTGECFFRNLCSIHSTYAPSTQASNGGSTTLSKPPWEWGQLVASNQAREYSPFSVLYAFSHMAFASVILEEHTDVHVPWVGFSQPRTI